MSETKTIAEPTRAVMLTQQDLSDAIRGLNTYVDEYEGVHPDADIQRSKALAERLLAEWAGKP